MAWNFNSGLAAIDGILSHLLGHQDILVVSRNIYGGSYQLIKDWYSKASNLDVALEWVDGYSADDFAAGIDRATERYADRLASGRKIYVFIESPCNPHGYVLDVAGISRASHERGCTIIADTTVGVQVEAGARQQFGHASFKSACADLDAARVDHDRDIRP